MSDKHRTIIGLDPGASTGVAVYVGGNEGGRRFFEPKTSAPVMPAFVVVETPVPFSAFSAPAYKQHWQAVQVVDFYRLDPMDRSLAEVNSNQIVKGRQC